MKKTIFITGASSGNGSASAKQGQDALYLLDARSKMSDDAFFAMQKQQFDL